MSSKCDVSSPDDTEHVLGALGCARPPELELAAVTGVGTTRPPQRDVQRGSLSGRRRYDATTDLRCPGQGCFIDHLSCSSVTVKAARFADLVTAQVIRHALTSD